MQSCLKCGWDTRSGSRICAACRTADAAKARAESVADPNVEKEALLTAVLKSEHSDTGIGEDASGGQVADSGVDHGDVAEIYESVTLREISRSEDEEARAVRSGAGGAEGTGDVVSSPDDSSPDAEPHHPDVSTSLVDAFDEENAFRKNDVIEDPTAVEEPIKNGVPPIGEDTAEDLVALFERPTPWERGRLDEPVHVERDTDTAQPSMRGYGDETGPLGPRDYETDPSRSYGYDTAEDLAALFNVSAPWDTSSPRRAASAEPDTDSDALPALYGPHPYAPSTGEMEALTNDRGADVDEPVDRWSTGDLDTGGFETEGKGTTYSASEWPWVGRSGDGGFWAPPTDRHETTGRGYGTTADAPYADVYDDSSLRWDEDAPDVRDPANPLDSTASTPTKSEDTAPDEEGSLAERLKAGFVELGAWTAVAQVALLAVGMLCIIQVFVLIVVSSYLSDARGQGTGVVAGSLAAHAKVDEVMLPALLVFTVAALAFAVWRSLASRGNAPSRRVGVFGRPLGIPMTLWRVFLAAITLLLVIIPDTPSTIDAAQRITQWAMVACAVLGAACFAAPRGLDPSPPAAKNRGGGTNTHPKPKASTSASSRSAA